MPRQCGIATFTTDLSDAIAAEFSHQLGVDGKSVLLTFGLLSPDKASST
jgi:hypothetical protein